MTQNPKIRPTDSELEILQVLWSHGEPMTVRQINDILAANRKVGYTTTLKLMQIMFEKGMLMREEAGRSHRYEAKVSQTDTQRALLDRFMDTAFGGSAMKLVMQALGGRKTSREELQQIKAYLNRLDEEQHS